MGKITFYNESLSNIISPLSLPVQNKPYNSVQKLNHDFQYLAFQRENLSTDNTASTHHHLYLLHLLKIKSDHLNREQIKTH